LLLRNVEVVFDELDLGARQTGFELRRLAQKLFVLAVRAETHHRLDAGAVVPRAVEQHELAAGRQVRREALKIPRRPIAIGRFAERHDARLARAQVGSDSLDRAVLARAIAPLNDDGELLAMCDE